MLAIIALIVAYLIGSVSGTAIIAHYSQMPDPRTQGLQNLSSENMLQLAGKEKALATIAIDGIKGLVAIILATILGVGGFMLGLTLLAVLIGHYLPAYYKFKGGNGIAPVLGGAIAVSFIPGVLLIGTWFALTMTTRLVYLATLAAAALLPVLMLIFGSFSYVIPCILIAALVIWRNINHLNAIRAGTEAKTIW